MCWPKFHERNVMSQEFVLEDVELNSNRVNDSNKCGFECDSESSSHQSAYSTWAFEFRIAEFVPHAFQMKGKNKDK